MEGRQDPSRVEETKKSETSSDKKKGELATVGEIFSFVKTREVKLCIAGAMICATISGLTLPAVAFYFARAFEDLAASTDSSTFLKGVRNVAFAFLVIGGIILLSFTLQTTLIETAAGEMTRELKNSWFQALLRQDMAYYDLQDVSGQATLISANGRKYRKGVGRKFAEAVQFFITFLGSLAYAFYASWAVTLAILAVSPVLVVSTIVLIKVITTQTARANETYAKAGAVVTTSVTSIRTILSLNAVDKMIGLYKAATAEALEQAVKNAWILGFANGAQFISMLLAYIMVTLFGSFMLYRNVRATGCDPSNTVDGVTGCDPSGMDVFGSLMGVSFAAAVLPQVSIALEAFTGARSACYPALLAMRRRIHESDDEKDIELANSSHAVRRELGSLPVYQIDSSSKKGLKLSNVVGNLEFRNVSFSFPARPDAKVLQNFSLKIEAGKTVALVGHSGSGKSTVVQLIERFYDPLSGSITLDGTDLRSLNVKWLREQIGMVLQEPKLFGKSIRDNISLGAPGVTQEKIEAAAKMANAHDFIMSFPKGYDTQVGDLGGQLSGGQKQRIAIARVLVKQPKIFLFDEATSALDSESEAAVQQALDQLMKMESTTTFVIAHRLSTIKNADMIAVIEDGAIVETGTHTELLAKQGVYFGLVEAQKTKRDKSEKLGTETSDSSMPRSEPGSRSDSEHGGLRVSGIDPSALQENVGPAVIRFSNVHFRYPARRDVEVFRGLNLAVRRGETLALVGPSGSGKSTVIQLIECFYHPTCGSVEYQGINLKDINIRWLRDELGLVSQEATLFATTVEENIRYGYPEATKDQIIEAAKQANCHDFITAFPDGYNTFIGEGGSLVSGGQKQRIAIARAIVKKPKVLLLDEATSALDSESEKVVQAALDKVMADKSQTCVVIAHRLSTIRNADRIAVIDQGKVREIGTHDELMSRPDSRYRRLQELQNLDVSVETAMDSIKVAEKTLSKAVTDEKIGNEEEEVEISKTQDSQNVHRAWLLGKQELPWILLGFVGALIAGLFFPSWGVMFAYMIELFYQRVELCPLFTPGFATCQDYYDSVASNMQQLSLKIFYGYLGLCVAAVIGNMILFLGFGNASERMSKRVRDAAFTSLIRQEVAWFDMRAPGTISSHLAEDAAMLHAFAGEPIRTITLSVASVLVGLVVSFVFMWPFALLTLGILPFLAFGAEMEMKTYLGDDEGAEESPDEHSPGGIVIETLNNMRTVASLTLEEERAAEYDQALIREDPNAFTSNLVKGSAGGTGQFCQMGGFAIMFWWGGWLLLKYPDVFSYRGFLISMFSLFFSMYGLTIAAQGAVDRKKAKQAAHRIFALTDRQSEIDPLGQGGKKNV